MVLCKSSVCIFQWITFVPTIFLGFPLNIAALWMLFFKIRRLTESTVYLTNLVINDCLLIFSLPFKVYAYERSWDLGPKFCSFLESLVYVNIYGSIALIVCISIDRYIALRYPFKIKSFRSPRKAAVVCLVIWLVVFGASPYAYRLHDSRTSCFQNFTNSTWTKTEILVAMETVFLVSAVIMIFCSVQIVNILRDLRKRNPLDKKLMNNKSIKIVLSNLITFLVCFIPYHIAVLTYFYAKVTNAEKTVIDPLRIFVHVSSCLSSVNCLFDGICYYFILKENWMSSQTEKKKVSVYFSSHQASAKVSATAL